MHRKLKRFSLNGLSHRSTNTANDLFTLVDGIESYNVSPYTRILTVCARNLHGDIRKIHRTFPCILPIASHSKTTGRFRQRFLFSRRRADQYGPQLWEHRVRCSLVRTSSRDPLLRNDGMARSFTLRRTSSCPDASDVTACGPAVLLTQHKPSSACGNTQGAIRFLASGSRRQGHPSVLHAG